MLAYLLVPAALSYLILVRTLRYRRINQTQKQHGSTPAEYAKLHYKDAQGIIGALGLFECPYLFLAGKDFAFLRAFAIPGISRVSVSAREMLDQTGKRYADTTVLVGTFLIHPLDSPLACTAINRMNWIHSRYGSALKMDQMVYTLCLLTCEALQWIDAYEWRATTPLEKHASWVFWSEVGRRMGLVGVPGSWEACAAFVEEFESREMRASRDNERIAQAVLKLYAECFPKFLAPVVEAVVSAFMDERLTAAFGLPAKKTAGVHGLLKGLLMMRKLFVRHAMLPRYSTLQVFGEEDAAGFRAMKFYEIEPWYVAKGNGNWLYRVYARMLRLPIAGDEKYRPEGYKLHELGPKHLEGKGGEEVKAFVEGNGACAFSTFGQFENKVYRTGGGGCPMMKA